MLIPIIFLSYMGLKSSLTYYYEVNELLDKGTEVYGKNVRVGGEVAPGSQSDVTKFELRFTLLDINGENSIPVIYNGAVPDTFRDGRGVIIEGKYTAAGIFEAKTIITKCGSKYEPADARN